MNHLNIAFAFAVCVVCMVGTTSFKVKRKTSLSSKLSEGAIRNGRIGRKRTSTKQKSYKFFDNRSDRTVQLWWRVIGQPGNNEWKKYKPTVMPGSVAELYSFFHTEWKATDINSNAELLINEKTRYSGGTVNTPKTPDVCIIKREDQTDTKIKAYVETFVLVDKSVRDMFENQKEAKRYVKILVDATSATFKHESLTQHGLFIDIIPSKIKFLDHELEFDPAEGGRNLYKACVYMNRIANSRSKRYDHKLFLTRNGFGAGGYARRGAMCSPSSSCSIVFDQGFQAAYLMAHEIGHAFGLRHGEYEQESPYIMSPLVSARTNFHRWSKKSQVALLRRMRFYNYCLKNKASTKPCENPGEFYTFEKQCDLDFGESYTAWKPSEWESTDPCKRLRCNMPGKYSFLSKTTGAPALDGTKCGDNKWCQSGRCLKRLKK